ncbi:sialidase family protein [Paenibacillus cymbidii]|uniref:sialidase family protein n=1 Tax=Paenibacillus cymbidii TaxID=1639034 RepID=UPI0014366FF7|nr:sialidase family protein [Paenibacillus cymbidii]
MERYIAIDNVCAWPNLTLLPNGSIAAIVYNRPNHGATEGHVECWISEDGGHFWRFHGVPAPHRPQENRINVIAGLSDEGDYLVLCSGFVDRAPYVPLAAAERIIGSRILDAVICRSTDGGRSWVQEGVVEKPEGVFALIPYGDIVRDGEGRLGAAMYTTSADPQHEGKRVNCVYFYRSCDQGKSWGEPVPIVPAALAERLRSNETAVLSLGGQRVLAAARTQDDQHLELFLSEDFGGTWTAKGQVSLAGQIPAHLLRLQDGRILLAYGMRNVGCSGICARISSDDGTSWSRPVLIVDFQNRVDGGYPSTVQLADGTLVTAYYAKNVPHHNRYHMGILRWKVDEFFEQ